MYLEEVIKISNLMNLDVKDLSNYILIRKEDINNLLKQTDNRVWIDFNSLEKMTGLSRSKLDTILKRYREELDVYNGGPVKYPDGGRWSIEKEGIQKWLKENHSRIWSDDQRINI